MVKNKMNRHHKLKRITRETEIFTELDLDHQGSIKVETGFGMLDHILTLIAFWGGFNLEISCRGDLHVDAHHSVEDAGLCLGVCLYNALGEKMGIERAADARVPMDEALADVCLDLSGRPWLEWRGDELLPPVIAGEEKDLWREFYKAFCSSGKFNLHINFLYGKNGHHLLESAAKGCGSALSRAIKPVGNNLKSTKGELD